MNYKFPPSFISRLTSLSDTMTMLSPLAKRRANLREALKDGPMSATELQASVRFGGSQDDNGEDVVVKTLKGLIQEGQVYQLASQTKHKRYALTASGMAHA